MPRERKPVQKFNFKEMGGRDPTPPPPKKSKPSYYTEPVNPDGSSDTYETGSFMPRLRQPQPNSPDLVVQPAPADPNGDDMEPVTSPSASPVAPVDRRGEACGYTPITEVDKGTQTDPLVFPHLVGALPPFEYPHGTKWWFK
jgi:hypothetical protein